MQKLGKIDYASVLYIAGLKLVPRPTGIAKDEAPQTPRYIDETTLRGRPADELEQLSAEKEVEGAFSPSNLEDARKRILAAIVLRQGRSAFRTKLIAAYNGSCAVTGCDVAETLEAAHIIPYFGLRQTMLATACS